MGRVVVTWATVCEAALGAARYSRTGGVVVEERTFVYMRFAIAVQRAIWEWSGCCVVLLGGAIVE